MRHIFIINPNTAKRHTQKLTREITDACNEFGVEWEIYNTDRPHAAEDYSRKIAEAGITARFYACGGDGTLNEVANGIFGYDNAEVAAIPMGTGNDFIRNFSPSFLFSNIRAQIKGVARKFDIIKYNSRYMVNTINIGFDCAVVNLVEKLRNWPLIKGAKAYTICAFLEMFPLPRQKLRFIYDDGSVEEKNLLLCSIANGRYCGGGYKSNPESLLDDGKFDIITAKSEVGRFGFLNMVGEYKDGTVLYNESKNKHLKYGVYDKLTIEADESFLFCTDGEVSSAEKLELSVCKKGLNFSIPEGAILTSL